MLQIPLFYILFYVNKLVDRLYANQTLKNFNIQKISYVKGTVVEKAIAVRF